ncbi:tetratricopeptide repeat protein [Streptomonospora nanhaiensis]|uniref:tetratricopeptide repeat protein n=1 Tax=Streptomonospora nanhaiensis TaxID=1323731 RepID=UPI001C98F205|nr:tetratricopeptide repeat protein [Streptomonospora nanhaiensis]MBX9387324.1 tetratricopeptide repeat protein [Streptomonospora nanhaiensis]
MTAVPRAAIPDEVLRRQDVQDALKRRDFGRLFFLARRWAGISYSAIAESCDIKPERVGTLARGTGSITSYQKIEQIADGMRVPGHLLGLQPRHWELADRNALHSRAEPAVGDVQGIRGAVHGASNYDLGHRLARGSAEFLRDLDRSGPGEMTIEQMAADLRGIAFRYLREPTPPLLVGLGQIRDEAREHLTRPGVVRRRDLLVLAGWSMALMGWMSVDMGRPDLAGTHARAAWMCGEAADHDGLRAWTCKTWQMVEYWAQRRPQAAAHTERGAIYADRAGGGAALIMLSALALDYARLGREDDALTTLNRARDAAERLTPTGDTDLGGPMSCTPERAVGYWADTYLVLGHSKEALALADEAVAASESAPGAVRNMGTERMMRCHQAIAHLQQRDLDAAQHALARVLVTPPELRAAPLRLRMHDITALLPDDTAGRSFADTLTGFATAPGE